MFSSDSRLYRQDQEGRSIWETILVIVIILLLTLGGLLLYRFALNAYQATTIWEDVMTRAAGLRNRGGSVGRNKFDTGMGDKTRTGLTMNVPTPGENSTTFSVEVLDIDSDVCEQLLKKDWPVDAIENIHIRTKTLDEAQNIQISETVYRPLGEGLFLLIDKNGRAYASEICDKVNDNFDLIVTFASSYLNSHKCEKNTECLHCEECRKGVCVDVCNEGRCMSTKNNPEGECVSDEPCSDDEDCEQNYNICNYCSSLFKRCELDESIYRRTKLGGLCKDECECENQDPDTGNMIDVTCEGKCYQKCPNGDECPDCFYCDPDRHICLLESQWHTKGCGDLVEKECYCRSGLWELSTKRCVANCSAGESFPETCEVCDGCARVTDVNIFQKKSLDQKCDYDCECGMGLACNCSEGGDLCDKKLSTHTCQRRSIECATDLDCLRADPDGVGGCQKCLKNEGERYGTCVLDDSKYKTTNCGDTSTYECMCKSLKWNDSTSKICTSSCTEGNKNPESCQICDGCGWEDDPAVKGKVEVGGPCRYDCNCKDGLCSSNDGSLGKCKEKQCEKCEKNEDCDENEVCYNGCCKWWFVRDCQWGECKKDTDCSEGYICNSKGCCINSSACESNKVCKKNEDCSTGYACNDEGCCESIMCSCGSVDSSNCKVCKDDKGVCTWQDDIASHSRGCYQGCKYDCECMSGRCDQGRCLPNCTEGTVNGLCQICDGCSYVDGGLTQKECFATCDPTLGGCDCKSGKCENGVCTPECEQGTVNESCQICDGCAYIDGGLTQKECFAACDPTLGGCDCKSGKCENGVCAPECEQGTVNESCQICDGCVYVDGGLTRGVCGSSCDPSLGGCDCKSGKCENGVCASTCESGERRDVCEECVWDGDSLCYKWKRSFGKKECFDTCTNDCDCASGNCTDGVCAPQCSLGLMNEECQVCDGCSYIDAGLTKKRAGSGCQYDCECGSSNKDETCTCVSGECVCESDCTEECPACSSCDSKTKTCVPDSITGAVPEGGSCSDSCECGEGFSCSNGTCGSDCTDTSDCPDGQECQDNVCTTPCSAEYPCPGDQNCQDGKCIDGCGDGQTGSKCSSKCICAEGYVCDENSFCREDCRSDGSACGSDGDCCNGSTCSDGTCAVVCDEEHPCPEGEECKEGVCKESCEHSCDEGCCSNETCIDGCCQSIAGCVPDAEKPCRKDSDCPTKCCQDGVCIPPQDACSVNTSYSCGPQGGSWDMVYNTCLFNDICLGDPPECSLADSQEKVDQCRENGLVKKNGQWECAEKSEEDEDEPQQSDVPEPERCASSDTGNNNGNSTSGSGGNSTSGNGGNSTSGSGGNSNKNKKCPSCAVCDSSGNVTGCGMGNCCWNNAHTGCTSCGFAGQTHDNPNPNIYNGNSYNGNPY